MLFGEPQFTDGDLYAYTGPDWFLGASKTGGEWLSNSWHCAATAPSNTGALLIDLDRSALTNDLVLDLRYTDHAGSSLHMDLLGTNDQTVAADVHGNLLSGSGKTFAQSIIPVPLATNLQAATVRLRRGAGETTVNSCILYMDADADGLDDAQEIQHGTSDHNADTDGDGFADGDEINLHGTDPMMADTDVDGWNDRYEIEFGSDPLDPAEHPDDPLTLWLPADTQIDWDAPSDASVTGEALATGEYAPVELAYSDELHAAAAADAKALYVCGDISGGLVADSSGGLGDLALHGGVATATGLRGQGLEFDGSGWLQASAGPVLNGPTDFSVSVANQIDIVFDPQIVTV